MYESDKLFCTTFLSCQTHDIKKKDVKNLSIQFPFLSFDDLCTLHISCSGSVGLLHKNEHLFSLSSFQKRFHTMLIRTITARLICVWQDSLLNDASYIKQKRVVCQTWVEFNGVGENNQHHVGVISVQEQFLMQLLFKLTHCQTLNPPFYWAQFSFSSDSSS